MVIVVFRRSFVSMAHWVGHWLEAQSLSGPGESPDSLFRDASHVELDDPCTLCSIGDAYSCGIVSLHPIFCSTVAAFKDWSFLKSTRSVKFRS